MKSVILLVEITKETLQDVKLSIKKYNRFSFIKRNNKNRRKRNIYIRSSTYNIIYYKFSDLYNYKFVIW